MKTLVFYLESWHKWLKQHRPQKLQTHEGAGGGILQLILSATSELSGSNVAAKLEFLKLKKQKKKIKKQYWSVKANEQAAKLQRHNSRPVNAL